MGGDWNSLTHSLPEVVNLHEAEATLEELEQMVEDGDDLDFDEQEQLDSLRALKEAIGSDWDYTRQGMALISEGYWRQYAEEFAYDIGTVERDSDISNYIDWDKWADAVQQDFTEVEVTEGVFEGTWWYRV